jgi:hypothetical protein
MTTEEWVKFGALLVFGSGGIGAAAYFLAPAIDRMADRRKKQEIDVKHNEALQKQMFDMQNMLNAEWDKRAKEWGDRIESQQKEIGDLKVRVERSETNRMYVNNRVMKLTWAYDDIMTNVKSICDMAKNGTPIPDAVINDIESKPTSQSIIDNADRETSAQLRLNNLSNGNTT